MVEILCKFYITVLLHLFAVSVMCNGYCLRLTCKMMVTRIGCCLYVTFCILGCSFSNSRETQGGWLLLRAVSNSTWTLLVSIEILQSWLSPICITFLSIGWKFILMMRSLKRWHNELDWTIHPKSDWLHITAILSNLSHSLSNTEGWIICQICWYITTR